MVSWALRGLPGVVPGRLGGFPGGPGAPQGSPEVLWSASGGAPGCLLCRAASLSEVWVVGFGVLSHHFAVSTSLSEMLLSSLWLILCNLTWSFCILEH